MSVDLRSNSSFGRISVLLMDDAVVKLEHGRTEDRIRKYRYETIESVIIWRKVAWVQVIVCALLIALPGLLLLLINNFVSTVFGAMLITLGVGLIIWYLYCWHTTIRIIRAGKNNDLTGIFRPGKVRRFRDNLVMNIRTTQGALVTAEPTVEATAPLAPDLPAEPPAY